MSKYICIAYLISLSCSSVTLIILTPYSHKSECQNPFFRNFNMTMMFIAISHTFLDVFNVFLYSFSLLEWLSNHSNCVCLRFTGVLKAPVGPGCLSEDCWLKLQAMYKYAHFPLFCPVCECASLVQYLGLPLLRKADLRGKLYCSEVALSYHAASIDHPKFHDVRIENKIKI